MNPSNSSSSKTSFDPADVARRMINVSRESDTQFSGCTPPVAATVAASTMPLDKIQPRAENARPLNPEHVVALAETIAALGLIEPLVVDCRGRLLAGAHRLAALHLLRETDAERRVERLRELVGADADVTDEVIERLAQLHDPDAATDGPPPFARHFDGSVIPVHYRQLDAELNPAEALEVEIAENERRRDYTGREIQHLVDRLTQAGYRIGPGRPKAGERTINDALAVCLGKSKRAVVRYLDRLRNGKPAKRTNAQRLAQAHRRLHAAVKAWLKFAGTGSKTAENRALETAVKRLNRLLSDDQPNDAADDA